MALLFYWSRKEGPHSLKYKRNRQALFGKWVGHQSRDCALYISLMHIHVCECHAYTLYLLKKALKYGLFLTC